jgi:phage terminase large subunit
MILPNLETTTVFSRNRRAFEEGYKIIVNQGGTSSSKTYSILQLLIILAASPVFTAGTISIVSESIPHLKRGAIRDFQKILGDKFDDMAFNRTDHIYKFEKSQIEFFSADDSARLRGGRRNILFLNECNNITMDSFDELDVRTEGSTFLDYNPVSEFWIHQLLQQNGINDFTKDSFPLDHRKICFIHSTYLQARQVLPKDTIDKIESRRERNPNWWNVYGLGLVGNIEGLVHPLFTTCDEMPLPGSGTEFYGLDFGFTDETSLIKCIVVGDQLYCDQLIYETGLTNPQISRRMESLGVRKNHDEIFADSAEPKSIKEIASYGFNIKGVEKGPDSVRAGILKVNEYRQVWTKRSVDSIKEQRNFRYIQKDDGTFTDKPMDDFGHSMAARRYAVISKHLQAIERMKCLVHDISKYVKDEPLGGFYEVINGFAVRENWATIITCQWDKDNGLLHVNFEATMNTIENIKVYCDSVKKAMNIAPPVMNPTNGAAVQNLVSQLIAQKVPVVVDQTFDAIGTLYFLNNVIDRRKFTMNSQAESLRQAMQSDTEVKNLSPHLEALLYIVNNIAIKVKAEDNRKPLKMFSKEKFEYQKEQELALKGRERNPDGSLKPIDKGYAQGWV